MVYRSNRIIKLSFLFLLALLLVNLTPLKAKSVVVRIKEEASIRLNEDGSFKGLVFYSELDQSLKDYEHGFYLVYGKTTVSKLEVALNTNNLINNKKIFKETIEGLSKEGYFSVVLTNIPESGYFDNITAISYVVIDDITYYSDPFTITVAETAVNLDSKGIDVSSVIDVVNSYYSVSFEYEDNYIITKGIYEHNHLNVIDKLISDWVKLFDVNNTNNLTTLTNNIDEFLNHYNKWNWLADYFNYLTDKTLNDNELGYSLYNFIYSSNQVPTSGNVASFDDSFYYELLIYFNNSVTKDLNEVVSLIKDGDVILLDRENSNGYRVDYYLINNSIYYPGQSFSFSDTYNTLEVIWQTRELDSISSFLANNYPYSYISGVITSFAGYNHIAIEDFSGAVALRIPYNTANTYIDLGYQIGDRVIAKVKKIPYNGLIQAEVIDLELEYVNSNNYISEPILLNNLNLDNITLFQYMSKRVTLHDFVITSKEEKTERFEYILSNVDKNILLTIDKRLSTIDPWVLDTYNVGDVLDINNALLSWFNGPQLMIDNVNQITVTSSVIVPDEDDSEFKIFYLNDTHGAVLNDGQELGLSRIGNYIKNTRNDNSIFITGGDIFQGQLISNANKGALMLEIFNELELDAFVIGNHEFDWGLDVVLKYFDPSYSGVRANFPILGANVIKKSTNQRPDFIDSHTIIERDGKKIGIIGVIGDGLEGSIAYKRVEEYKFTDAYTAVANTVNLIKNEVDFIIVVNHGGSSTFNNSVSYLPKVSAIFNAHTHREELDYIGNIPVMQSRHNGFMVGEVDLTFSQSGFQLNLIDSYARNVKYHTYLNTPDQTIENIINSYYEDLYPLYEEVILTASRSMSQNDLAYFISRLIKEASGAVAGFQNSGGTRNSMYSGQQITAADIYQITPFENQIIVVEIDGWGLKQLLSDSYFFTTSDYESHQINNSQMYKVATNDYVYYSTYNTHVFGSYYGTEIEFGDIYETFYEALLTLKAMGYQYFDTNTPLYFNTTYHNLINYYDVAYA